MIDADVAPPEDLPAEPSPASADRRLLATARHLALMFGDEPGGEG